ncbi:aspartokinase 1, chloroplastic isoform X2 [Aegilops tauschii subsp. strangulata]|uniref:aspartokinase 1, chloroplastic isoform X2 n=1 Tax=Aegilops tauschii subsp. strangulata TaxID=200361 RepID=UPI003CC8983C
MVEDLGLHRSIASGSLDELENVFMAIAVMKELTSKTRDYLVYFGQHMSTRIFSAYLNKLEEGARQEWESFAVDTCGRGGSDLTMTTIGRDSGSREIQVWKDVNGVLTCDPSVCANAIPLPYLTFDEAAELGLFGGQSMQLAMEGGIPVIVKNLCNPQAPGTMITKTRDMSKSVLTSIVSRSNITVLNIESTRILDHSVFLATGLCFNNNF